MKRLALVLLALAFVGCNGPFLLLSGGALQGTTASAPADWSSLDGVDTIQLETNPAAPYSVNIWITGIDDVLYAHAGANRAEWIANMEADPRVRLRIGEAVYELVAVRTRETTDLVAARDALTRKYDFQPSDDQAAQAILYRLGPR